MDLMLVLAGVFTVFIPALMLPGPDFVAVVRSSMSRGTIAGLLTTCGVSIGLGFYATLSLLGLSAILVEFQWLTFLVRVLGGSYLNLSRHLTAARPVGGHRHPGGIGPIAWQRVALRISGDADQPQDDCALRQCLCDGRLSVHADLVPSANDRAGRCQRVCLVFAGQRSHVVRPHGQTVPKRPALDRAGRRCLLYRHRRAHLGRCAQPGCALSPVTARGCLRKDFCLGSSSRRCVE